MEHETHFHFLEVREQSYSLFLGGNLLLEHSFTHSKVPWTWSWDFRGGILHPPLTTCWWLEEQEKTELHSSSQDRAGLSGFVPQPPRKVDTSIIYLTNRDFRGWVTSPSSQRSGERGWGLQRLCPFPKPMHFPICHPVWYQVLSEPPFLDPWSRNWWYLLCALAVLLCVSNTVS